MVSRLKFLETEVYSQKEAEAAAGMGSYVPPKKRKVETQQTDETEPMENSETVITDKLKRKKVKSSSNNS